ncbi:MAG: exodeoxyribonuclease VII large subunit [Scytonematopsis contorta HA4267-MV1]|jgi:exodeoxyribonuclease VII large subunit|nr:exodeoxyribonuclease VII large subunit [Scytonematopsis contorta HA4267-MV1]
MSADLSKSIIPETALSVAGLTDYIQALLEENEILSRVWVVGEVSSANNHRSGLFFTLQDTNGSASIKCVAWNSQLPKLAQIPKVGEQIIILGSIRLYPQRGEYQILVWQSLPAGLGLQALRFQQLRNRLLAEGLFDEERKRTLPIHPQTIAVVTSSTAAAWGDIKKTLKQRYPGLQVLFSPATVQGDLAPDSIVKAIELVQKDGRAEVLILARGGGAVEDLSCFNDERVVRVVANCPIPVVTGIGHQRDESLVDLVADVSVHTPTAAAELVVPSLDDLYNQHRERVAVLVEAVNYRLQTAQKELKTLHGNLRRLRLDKEIQQELQGLAWRHQRLIGVMTARLQDATQRVDLLKEKLATLDPKAVLKRGYAVVRVENGAIVRESKELSVGDELVLQLGKGEVKAKVTEIGK